MRNLMLRAFLYLPRYNFVLHLQTSPHRCKYTNIQSVTKNSHDFPPRSTTSRAFHSLTYIIYISFTLKPEFAGINQLHKPGLARRPFRVGGACRQHRVRDVRRPRPIKAERHHAIYRRRHLAGHSTWASFSQKDQGR